MNIYIKSQCLGLPKLQSVLVWDVLSLSGVLKASRRFRSAARVEKRWNGQAMTWNRQVFHQNLKICFLCVPWPFCPFYTSIPEWNLKANKVCLQKIFLFFLLEFLIHSTLLRISHLGRFGKKQKQKKNSCSTSRDTDIIIWSAPSGLRLQPPLVIQCIARSVIHSSATQFHEHMHHLWVVLRCRFWICKSGQTQVLHPAGNTSWVARVWLVSSPGQQCPGILLLQFSSPVALHELLQLSEPLPYPHNRENNNTSLSHSK